jgi:hypothetical protein
MHTIVEMKTKNEVEVEFFKYNEFAEELKQGYLYWELEKKQQQLSEYINAYQEIEDKDSFNAQYLETLIDLLKSEIID